MKMGTIAGVLAAAAAVVAILVSAPARAATSAALGDRPDMGAAAYAAKREPDVGRSAPEPASWLLMLLGIGGLGVMLRAGRDGMSAR